MDGRVGDLSTTRRFVYTCLPINIPHTSRLEARNMEDSPDWCPRNSTFSSGHLEPNVWNWNSGISIYYPIDITILINAILLVNRRIPSLKKNTIIKPTTAVHWVPMQLFSATQLVLNNSFPNTNLLRIAHLHG